MINRIFVLFLGNLLAKLLGVLREIVFAALYGTSIVAGTFRLALGLVLMPIQFLTSDILNSVFIPLYKRLKNSGNGEENELFSLFLLMFSFFSILIFLFTFIFSGWIVNFAAPGISDDARNLAVSFLKVMSFSVPFYILSALYANLAFANDRVLLMSVRPIFQSISLVSGCLLSYFFNDVYYLAYSFSLFYFFLFIISYLYVNEYVHLKFVFSLKYDVFNEFWERLKPLLPLPFFLQGNLVVERIISSYFGAEYIASVDYARFIIETGIALIAIPVGYVGLSVYAGLCINQLKLKLRKTIFWVVFYTVPMSIYLLLYSDQIISFIYARGGFDKESIEYTSAVLEGMSVGFWAQVVSYIFIKSLNAIFKNKIVLYFMVIALLLNAVFNFAFYDFFGYRTVGIGVSVYSFSLVLFCLFYFNYWRVFSLSFLAAFPLILICLLTFMLFDSFYFSTFFLFFFVFMYSFLFKDFRFYLFLFLKKVRRGE